MHAVRAIDPPPAAVVFADDVAQLARVREPGVHAVVFDPAQRPPWEAEVAAAVESGAFVIERCIVTVECSGELVHALEQRLPHQGLPYVTRLALVDDLGAMADRLTAIAGCRGVMARLLTEAPTEHCGFHIDTVAPGAPAYGLLKVYNGRGTHYVEPADVVDMRRFYDYLGRRERLARERRAALDAGDASTAGGLREAIQALDAALPFLRRAAPVHDVPAGATVAFRNLDVREHWSAHAREGAWIHCSPMAGATRLVANFTPLDGLAGRLR